MSLIITGHRYFEIQCELEKPKIIMRHRIHILLKYSKYNLFMSFENFYIFNKFITLKCQI